MVCTSKSHIGLSIPNSISFHILRIPMHTTCIKNIEIKDRTRLAIEQSD